MAQGPKFDPETSGEVTALDKVRLELRALAPEDIRLPRIDVERAVDLVLRAQVRVEARREEILAACPGFNPDLFEATRLAAMALRDANAAVKRDPCIRREMSDLVAEAKSARRLLLRTAGLVEFLGEPGSARLHEMRGRQDPKMIAEDLIELSSMLEKAWARVETHVPLTRTQLERALKVGEKLLHALEEGFETERDSVDLRNRAFTLLRLRYEEMRRVVTYVRWHHGDANEIAPSLFTLRKRRSRVSRYSKPMLSAHATEKSPTASASS